MILTIPQSDNAFDKLYEKTKTIVFAYIMSIIKNYDDSRDILQEVYIKIYLASQQYVLWKNQWLGFIQLQEMNVICI